MVPIDDVMGTHVLQVDPLFFKELEGFVDILETVDPHATPRGPRLGEWQRDGITTLLQEEIKATKYPHRGLIILVRYHNSFYNII